MTEALHREGHWAAGVLAEIGAPCGCGEPADVLGMLRDLLADMPLYESAERRERYQTPQYAFILAVLTEAGLLAHGGILTGSWIEPKGARLLAYLKAADLAALAADPVGLHFECSEYPE